MSEELDALTKAQSALFKLKKYTKYMDAVTYSSVRETTHDKVWIYRHTESFEDVIEPLSQYIRLQFDKIAKSNKKIKTSEMKPIYTRNLQKETPIKVFKNKGKKMAAKKAVKKVPVKKAPMKKGKK